MKEKAREVRLSLGSTFMTLRRDSEEQPKPNATMRGKLSRWLDQVPVHTTVVLLVITDSLLLISLLLIDQRVIQAPIASQTNCSLAGRGDTSVRVAESVLHIINIIICFIFLIEVTVRVVAGGVVILKDKLQVFDCVVVIVTFILYIVLTAARVDRTITYSTGFVIMLRLWRLSKVYSGIQVKERRRAERVINMHRKAREQAEDQVKQLHVRLSQKQEEIDGLYQRLNSPRKSAASLTGTINGIYTTEGHSRVADIHVGQRKSWSEGLDKAYTELANIVKVPNGSLPGISSYACQNFAVSSEPQLCQKHATSLQQQHKSKSIDNICHLDKNIMDTNHKDIYDINTKLGTYSPKVTSSETVQMPSNLLTPDNSNLRPVSWPQLNNHLPQERAILNHTTNSLQNACETRMNNEQSLSNPSDKSLSVSVELSDHSYSSTPSGQLHSSCGSGDTLKLLKGGKESSDLSGYLNPGFELEASTGIPNPDPPLTSIPTPDEEMEIRRISQVPFDSADHLTEDGNIPMTDL